MLILVSWLSLDILLRMLIEFHIKIIYLVKVLRKNHGIEEVTREREDQMRVQFPFLFESGV
jgi:hypothetical protein